MDEEERDQEDQATRRPRVVDKRISARAAAGDETSAEPPREQPHATPPEESAAVPDPGRAQPPPPTSASPPEGLSEQPVNPPSAAGDKKVWTPQQEAEAARMAQEIADTPSLEWVVNTAVTLANVAATKLELGAGGDAQLAIDALAGILTSVGPRLQQAESPLRQTLAQLQLAYAERLTPPPPG